MATCVICLKNTFKKSRHHEVLVFGVEGVEMCPCDVRVVARVHNQQHTELTVERDGSKK